MLTLSASDLNGSEPWTPCPGRPEVWVIRSRTVTRRNGLTGSQPWLACESEHGVHFDSLEFRQKLLYRIEQTEATFVHEDHDAGRGKRLGHRHDTEDRIGAHGDSGFSILVADSIQAGNMAMPRRDGNETGGGAFVDVAFQHGGDSANRAVSMPAAKLSAFSGANISEALAVSVQAKNIDAIVMVFSRWCRTLLIIPQALPLRIGFR